MMQRLIVRARRYFATNRMGRKHVLYGGIVAAVLLLGAVILVNVSPYHASPDSSAGFFDPPHSSQEQIYVRATVAGVTSLSNNHNNGQQAARVKLLDGPDKGSIVSVERYGGNLGDASYKRLPVGSQVLLYKNTGSDNPYSYVDRYRIPGAVTLVLMLVSLILIIARWRGVTAVIGLAISILILLVFVIPRIIHGHDAYTTCIEGAFMIAGASIYIAHGFTKRTTVAFIGAIVTLLLTVGITTLSSYLTGLTGYLGEDTLGIQYAKQHIGLASLLFGGIVIASLGVLNDITIGQAAAVDEIHKANKRQSGLQLYKRGMSVGREHIAALVNTLALAYVGVALPAVITTALYNNAPLLVILNSETVMEEIVRTAVVSMSLLLAVPVTTALAAYILPRWNDKFDVKFKKWLREL